MIVGLSVWSMIAMMCVLWAMFLRVVGGTSENDRASIYIYYMYIISDDMVVIVDNIQWCVML